MNKIIEKYWNSIVIIFLFMQPLLDLLTSLFINVLEINFTIGIIFRVIFLLLVIYYGLFINRVYLKKKIIYLIILGIYSIIYLSVNYISVTSSFIEIQNLVKVLYLPLLILFIDNIKIKDKYLVYITVIYSLLIIVPSILGINFNAYTQGKIGTVGLFNSANEISAILTILFPILFVYSFKKDLKKIIFLLCILPMFMIGSKIVVGAVLATILLILPTYLKKNKVSKKTIGLTSVIVILLIITSIVLVPRTNFYKNIIIHAQFLEINEVTDLFSYESIDRFIFSDRLTFLENTHDYYMSSNIENQIFGIGYISQEKLIEMDVFDIFYRFGLIGFLIIFYPLISKLKKINIKSKIEYLVSLLMIIILAFIVGHTLVAPAVSIYIFIILNKLTEKQSS